MRVAMIELLLQCHTASSEAINEKAKKHWKER